MVSGMHWSLFQHYGRLDSVMLPLSSCCFLTGYLSNFQGDPERGNMAVLFVLTLDCGLRKVRMTQTRSHSDMTSFQLLPLFLEGKHDKRYSSHFISTQLFYGRFYKCWEWHIFLFLSHVLSTNYFQPVDSLYTNLTFLFASSALLCSGNENWMFYENGRTKKEITPEQSCVIWLQTTKFQQKDFLQVWKLDIFEGWRPVKNQDPGLFSGAQKNDAVPSQRRLFLAETSADGSIWQDQPNDGAPSQGRPMIHTIGLFVRGGQIHVSNYQFLPSTYSFLILKWLWWDFCPIQCLLGILCQIFHHPLCFATGNFPHWQILGFLKSGQTSDFWKFLQARMKWIVPANS